MKVAIVQLLLLISVGLLAAYVAEGVGNRSVARMLRMVTVFAAIWTAAPWIAGTINSVAGVGERLAEIGGGIMGILNRFGLGR